jgi:hypothetical protein
MYLIHAKNKEMYALDWSDLAKFPADWRGKLLSTNDLGRAGVPEGLRLGFLKKKQEF